MRTLCTLKSSRAAGVYLAALFVVPILGGCGDSGRSAGAGEATGSGSEAVTEVCGQGPNGPVQGVDISEYQGNFSWSGRGLAFGYARISDGLYTIDPTFGANWAGMKAAGVLRGAYQFFEPGEDEVGQANLMVQKVGRLGAGDMPPMIDVEITGGQSGGTIGAKVAHWLQIVEAGTGKRPIIYTGSYFWQDNVGDTGLGSYPLWIAAYGTSCPSVPAGWSNWTFWQYSDGGGSLDHDVFNGSLAQLQALAGASSPPPRPRASGGPVVSWGPNRLDVFARGTDNALWHKWWDGSRWAGWDYLNGSFTGTPAVASWGSNRLDVFVRGFDDALWHQWWDGAQWTGWEWRGGGITSDPAVVSWGPNRIDVFARGFDDALWHQWWGGTQWAAWESLGGAFTSNPAAASWGSNRIDVLVRGTDNALWHKWWDGAQWRGWEGHGGALTSDPAAVSWQSNRLDVFVRGTDDALWHQWWDTTRWGGWDWLGGDLR